VGFWQRPNFTSSQTRSSAPPVHCHFFATIILALILLAIFYVNLYWFAPERTAWLSACGKSDKFHTITGLLTIDGVLNGRPDITLDALRHLVLPVVTLAFAHWATLARITRTTMIEELAQDYVTAAKARGIPEMNIMWRHALPNAIAPALTSSLLAAASLITGVFVVEIIFNFKGVSELAVKSMQFIPDAPAALGFCLYSVIVVLLLMFTLDLLQAIVDPRLRRISSMNSFRRFTSRWQNFFGVVIILFFIFVAIAAPLLSPMDAKNPSVMKTVGNSRDFNPHPPSISEPLGTLSRQISVYHALVWGSRSALVFGVTIAFLAMLIGILIGTISAYSGGFVHGLLMRISDTFLAFPIIAAVVLINQLFTILLTNAGVLYTMGGMGVNIFSVKGAYYLPEGILNGLPVCSRWIL
jgi:ABC-type dipeptide/oligopeptide/nickel transport system permease component